MPAEPLDLDALQKLLDEAWPAPWRARTFEIDCPCPNGNHCGDTHSCEEVEAPEAYPNSHEEPAAPGHGQCVVQIDVPGLESLAGPTAACIAALRNAAPELLRLARQALSAPLPPKAAAPEREALLDARARLEELFTATQAEAMVRHMLEGESGEVCESAAALLAALRDGKVRMLKGKCYRCGGGRDWQVETEVQVICVACSEQIGAGESAEVLALEKVGDLADEFVDDPAMALRCICEYIGERLHAIRARSRTSTPPESAEVLALLVAGLRGTRCAHCHRLLSDEAPAYPAPGSCEGCVGGREALARWRVSEAATAVGQ